MAMAQEHTPDSFVVAAGFHFVLLAAPQASAQPAAAAAAAPKHTQQQARARAPAPQPEMKLFGHKAKLDVIGKDPPMVR